MQTLKRIEFCFCFAALLLISISAQGQTLGEALNATNLTWTTSSTGSAQGWSVESSTTHDGVSAAQSYHVISSSQSSTLQTTVNGPGTITFWCYKNAFNLSTFSFTVNGITQTNFDLGIWQQQTFYLGPGTLTLKWINSGSPGGGTAYLDQVNYTAGVTAPIITSQPLAQSQVQGMDTTFTVAVGGTPQLSYQWQFNGTNISGASAPSYTVTNTQSTNLGYYSVIVTNIVGTTNSDNAMLEFGQITAWGFGYFGETSVSTGATNVTAISGGGYHNLALKADAKFLAWGLNSFGQLNAPADLSNVVAIKAGGNYSVSLSANGTVTAWGLNTGGQTNVPSGLSNVIAIATGASHAMSLKSDGSVIVWGSNAFGQTNVPQGLTNVVSIAAGDDHCLALRSDGTIVAWGYNANGLTNVPFGLSNVTAIAAGSSHSLALKSTGTVVAWGWNAFGQTNVPAGLSNVVAITGGGYHNLALRSDGTVAAWGRNLEGQTNVPPTLTNVVAVSGGGFHSLALVGNGLPVQNVLLKNAVLSNGIFNLSLPSESGRVYALEYKNSLTDSNWVALPLVAGNGTNLVVTDPTATNSQRFYHVRRW
jgi:hypothetical protein